MRLLETRLETATLDRHSLEQKLARSTATEREAATELDKKKAENARLVANLNEARAQLNFESKKGSS